MTDSNPRSYVHAEVLGGVQRRRRWTPEEKLRMVEETFLPTRKARAAQEATS